MTGRKAQPSLFKQAFLYSRTVLPASIWLLASAPVEGQVHEGRNLVSARLVADVSQAAPGSTFLVGLVLEQADGWHTYWQYAGDSGLATAIDWKLPDGVRAGDILWPVPKRLVEPGDLIVYAYKDRVVLLTEVSVPEHFREASLSLKATAKWLVCREICIPGKADLELTLPVGNEAAPQNDPEISALISEFASMLPDGTGGPPFRATISVEAGVSKVILEGWSPDGDVIFAPLPGEDQIIGHVQRANDLAADKITFEIPLLGGPHRPVPGVVVETLRDGSRRGWKVGVVETPPVADTNLANSANNIAQYDALSPASVSDENATPPLWQFLVYGFLGGMILNLMPCVLPVISLKIFGFIRQAGESRGRILRLGVAFSAGVFVWFLGLAAVIVLLRGAGSQVNWAFQFQNPVFLLLVCGLLVVVALNLFGVFEVTLPGFASRGLHEAAGREGYAGAFFHGVLATVLATPCTAPFLGTALGFAFTQPSPVVFAMFTAMAGGMALPFFVLSANPGWMKFLPKPGRWMESLKQFMGFPLLATLVWLLWVVGNQGGLQLVTRALAWLLALGMACWVVGRFGAPPARVPEQAIAWFVALLLAGGGWVYLLPGHAIAARPAVTTSQSPSDGGINWQPFSREAIARELEAGRPVFVDFTAEWCLTCKFNERTVINTPEVRELIARHDITMLKGDWTNADPAIGEFLAEHGRVGVPFYLVYSPADPGRPQILPELLTKPLLMAALEKAAAGTDQPGEN